MHGTSPSSNCPLFGGFTVVRTCLLGVYHEYTKHNPEGVNPEGVDRGIIVQWVPLIVIPSVRACKIYDDILISREECTGDIWWGIWSPYDIKRYDIKRDSL